MENVLKVQNEMYKEKIQLLYALWVLLLLCSATIVAIVVKDDEGVGLELGLLGGGMLLLINLLSAIQIVRMHLWKNKLDPSFDRLSSEEKARINAEIEDAGRYKNVIVCRDAVLIYKIALKAIPMKDIVWVYGKNVHQGGVVPLVTMSTIVLRDKRKKSYEIYANTQALMGKQSKDFEGTEDLWTKMELYAPWAYFGYEKNLVKNMGGFQKMVQTVEARQRREEVEQMVGGIGGSMNVSPAGGALGQVLADQEEEEEERVFLGIVGALLGGLIGSLFMMFSEEYVSVFMAIIVLAGYGMLGKTISRKAFPICMICIIFTSYLGQRMAYARMIAKELDTGFVESFLAIPDYLERGVWDSVSYWAELLECCGIAFIVLLIEYVIMRRRQR